MIPQKVLHAFGTPVAEDLWGITRIHTLLQADGSMERFGKGEKKYVQYIIFWHTQEGR